MAKTLLPKTDPEPKSQNSKSCIFQALLEKARFFVPAGREPVSKITQVFVSTQPISSGYLSPEIERPPAKIPVLERDGCDDSLDPIREFLEIPSCCTLISFGQLVNESRLDLYIDEFCLRF